MDKVQKLQRRLDAAMAQRQFYEAHQILRTMQWRMLPQQQQYNNNAQMGQKNTPQAEEQQQRMVELLHSGCLAMCEVKEYSSAIDLAELYVDALKRTGQQLNSEERMGKLVALFSQLPAHLQSEPEEEQKLVPSAPRNQEDRRTRFLNKTLDWALKSAQGRPELLEACVHLQRNFADVLASEGRTEQAERLVTAADWLLAEIERKMQSATLNRTGEMATAAKDDGSTSTRMEAEEEMKPDDIDLD